MSASAFVQISGGLIQRTGPLVKLLECATAVQQWNVTVRLQLTDCHVNCHATAGEGYDISLDWTSDSEDLKFHHNTHCLVQSFSWGCHCDPDDTGCPDDPPSNQDCVFSDENFDAPIGDVVVADHFTSDDPPVPIHGCIPMYKHTYSSIALYDAGDFVQFPAASGVFYKCILAVQGVAPPNARYWVEEDLPASFWDSAGGSSCRSVSNYSNGLDVTMSLFEGEWSLSASFSLLGAICGANVNSVFAAGLGCFNVPWPCSDGFPLNTSLGANPAGSYHFESGLGGTPTPPGTAILDIDIAPAA